MSVIPSQPGNSGPTPAKPERNVPLPRTLGAGSSPATATAAKGERKPWLGLKPASRALLVLFAGAVVALPPVTLGHSEAAWPIVVAALNFVFSLSLAAILSLFIYFVFRKSAAAGNATFCLAMVLSIAQVALMSQRFNKTVVDELTARGYSADEVMAAIKDRANSIKLAPAPAGAAPASTEAAAPATGAGEHAAALAPAKKGEPMVRVYRKP